MKKLILFSATVMLNIQSFTSIAQTTDKKAKKILDELSAQTKSYSSISADFSFTMENKVQKTSETQEGKITLKGNKYKLEVANQVIISDSKTVWTILKDAKEVQIDNNLIKDETINPSNIFTLYENGFKYEFVNEEAQKNGSTYQTIKLYPIDSKKKNFHTAILTIDKGKKQIVSIKILGKDGTDTTYLVKSFVSNKDIPESTFSFNTKDYPGYESIDLRQ